MLREYVVVLEIDDDFIDAFPVRSYSTKRQVSSFELCTTNVDTQSSVQYGLLQHCHRRQRRR
jgi:hypothetical protein